MSNELNPWLQRDMVYTMATLNPVMVLGFMLVCK